MSGRPTMGRVREQVRADANARRGLFERDPTLPIGRLPRDAEYRLKAAAKVGEPGSLERQRAINSVNLWIDSTYPQYLR